MSRGKTAASWTPADVSDPVLGERWGGVVLHPGRPSALPVPRIGLPPPRQHRPARLCFCCSWRNRPPGGEERCSATHQASKLIACKCTFVLEFPPAATAARQRPAVLRRGKGRPGKGATQRCSGEQCLLQPQKLTSSLH